jgi:hypothetical protein
MKAMLRAAYVGAMMSTAMLPVSQAAALTQQQLDAASNGCRDYADQKIDGRTAAIESGRLERAKLAWAFNNRAIAYQLKGDSTAPSPTSTI